jgi:hypothetical protein
MNSVTEEYRYGYWYGYQRESSQEHTPTTAEEKRGLADGDHDRYFGNEARVASPITHRLMSRRAGAA